MTKQPFFLISPRPWPIIQSLNLFNIINRLIFWMDENWPYLLSINLLLTTYCSLKWWKDIINESKLIGLHSFIIYINLKLRFIIFIVTESLLFISLLWNFFHNKSLDYRIIWPPNFIQTINPYEIPLINTFILFRSSITITWRHHNLINKNLTKFKLSSILTIMLGVFFITLQSYEFFTIKFNINDSIYGHCFFLTTGFHGIHVIIGLLFIFSFFLKIRWIRPSHHFNFEGAAWYWHFVDLVWLFVFTRLYLYLYNIKSILNFQFKSLIII